MKLRDGLIRRCGHTFSALFFAAMTWSRLHEKAIGEAVLYGIALAASIFLAVLPESIWGAKKLAGRDGQDESRKAVKP